MMLSLCVLYAGKNQFELSESVKTRSTSEVVVADATTPKPISLVVKYTQKME